MKQANSARIRVSLPASLGALALALTSVTGCSGAPDASLEGDEAEIAMESEELRGSSRFRSDVQTAQSQTGLPFGIDPVTGLIIPPPSDPNVDPNSGINYNDLSNVAIDVGGQCPGNSLMTGACPTYGIQCYVQQANATLYCTCLSNNSQGIQGWECR